MPRSIRVTDAEARMIDLISEIGIDVEEFVRVIERGIALGAAHPLTVAAAIVEAASFQTPVEAAATQIAAPTPAEF